MSSERVERYDIGICLAEEVAQKQVYFECSYRLSFDAPSQTI
ncbi:MAG: hypothetical protein ACJZ42_06070 [Candidatus Thalassarchaeaceae archaeon]